MKVCVIQPYYSFDPSETDKCYLEIVRLLDLDFGVEHGERFAGLKIQTFEEILRKFAGKVIMNIHVKIWDVEFENSYMPEIVALIRKYDAQGHCYIMTASDKRASEAMAYAPTRQKNFLTGASIQSSK